MTRVTLLVVLFVGCADQPDEECIPSITYSAGPIDPSAGFGCVGLAFTNAEPMDDPRQFPIGTYAEVETCTGHYSYKCTGDPFRPPTWLQPL